MINFKILCDYYFSLFSNKDLDYLSKLFTDDIQLIDWDINVSNKENVLKSIENIFNNVDSIEITPDNYYQDGNTICCEIVININNKENINVVDIITFNDKGKIKKIIAYKQ